MSMTDLELYLELHSLLLLEGIIEINFILSKAKKLMEIIF